MRAFPFVLILIFSLCFAAAYKLGSMGASLGKTMKSPVSQETKLTESQSEPLPKTKAPFHWSSLETTNYGQFVANLREIGCPEGTIRDIIRSELAASFAPQFAAINMSGNFSDPAAQWQEKNRKRAELNKNIESVLYEQLKLQRPVRSANALFTAEQEEKIAEAWRRFPPSNMSESTELSKSNKTARLEFLAQYLPPEQMTYYRLDHEGEAVIIQQVLKGLGPTKEEFLAVANAIEGKDTGSKSGVYQPELLEAVKGALSADRFELFQDIPRREYQQIFIFGRLHMLSDNTMSSLIKLRHKMDSETPENYRKQVEFLIGRQQPAAEYLTNKIIHPNRAE